MIKDKKLSERSCDSIIFNYSFGGLGVLLKTIASGQIISEQLNLPYIYVWFNTWDCGGTDINGSDLISNVDFFVPRSYPKKQHPKHLFKNKKYMSDCVKFAVKEMQNKYKNCFDFHEIGKSIIFHATYFNKFPPCGEVKKRIFPVSLMIYNKLREISPSNKIKEMVEYYEKDHNMSECIGVHVRRGDVPKRRLFGIKRYFSFLKNHKEFNDKKIFLCTENQKVINGFKERYKDRVLFRPPIENSRDSIKGIQNAYTDLLLLSKCKCIIGGKSSFSEVASIIGGIKKYTLIKEERL
jgi:hypothetical protein